MRVEGQPAYERRFASAQSAVMCFNHRPMNAIRAMPALSEVSTHACVPVTAYQLPGKASNSGSWGFYLAVCWREPCPNAKAK